MAMHQDQLSLFRHSGAGATLRSTWWLCLTCYWSGRPQLDTVRAGVPARLG